MGFPLKLVVFCSLSQVVVSIHDLAVNQIALSTSERNLFPAFHL